MLVRVATVALPIYSSCAGSQRSSRTAPPFGTHLSGVTLPSARRSFFSDVPLKSSLFAFPTVVAAVIQRGMRPMGIERADGSLEK